MATEYIAHVTAGTANKNLAVSGNIVEPPNIPEMWLNFQVDAGLTLSGKDVDQWLDTVNNNVIIGSADKPQMDNTRRLNGMETIRTGTTLRFLRKSGGITGAINNTSTVTTYCILFYGGTYVNPTDWDGQGTIRRILAIYDNTLYPARSPIIEVTQKPSTMEISAKVGGSAYLVLGTAITGWNILVVENSITEGVGRNIRASLNGGDVSINPFATGGWNRNIDTIEIGAYYNGSTQLFPGNYGALMAWKGVAFTADDFAQARNYLMFKYGLT